MPENDLKPGDLNPNYDPTACYGRVSNEDARQPPHESKGTLLFTRLLGADDLEDGHLHLCRFCGDLYWVPVPLAAPPPDLAEHFCAPCGQRGTKLFWEDGEGAVHCKLCDVEATCVASKEPLDSTDPNV